jgi:hypothetical protein
MPANTKIEGKVYNVNTTGLVTSGPVIVLGWLQTRYSTGAATISTGAVIVDRSQTTVPVIGAKLAAGQSIYVPLDSRLRVRGLSCSKLVTGTTVRIYCE